MKWTVLLAVLCVMSTLLVSVEAGILHRWNRYWWRFKHPPSVSNSIVFEDCGTQYDVISISLSGCTAAPCLMQRGTNVAVNAEFNAHGASTDSVLKHDVNFILNGVKTQASITPTTCDGSVCPRQGANGLLFSANIYVNPNLPPIHGKLRWELRNSRGDMLLCYQVPVGVV
ncbi:NPC intracellular cholesterol transporter 2 [Anopheles ziemanni]|uniref:NPC intracellular cholesterol transporter 2 n=1 Tax=Anopheles coustani TaxID=139045 RepID=UPI0026591811|nr:NPC intracellular cholesterol transporter 2 [Anopheles coustani]XP_058169732.1 NPC intracellular cholesterol transporter 2 [Anopheles ziemanni]